MKFAYNFLICSKTRHYLACLGASHKSDIFMIFRSTKLIYTNTHLVGVHSSEEPLQITFSKKEHNFLFFEKSGSSKPKVQHYIPSRVSLQAG